MGTYRLKRTEDERIQDVQQRKAETEAYLLALVRKRPNYEEFRDAKGRVLYPFEVLRVNQFAKNFVDEYNDRRTTMVSIHISSWLQEMADATLHRVDLIPL